MGSTMSVAWPTGQMVVLITNLEVRDGEGLHRKAYEFSLGSFAQYHNYNIKGMILLYKSKLLAKFQLA